MLNENILWARTINPVNGRIVREPTVLGAVLYVIGGAIVLGAAFYALIWLSAFL